MAHLISGIQLVSAAGYIGLPLTDNGWDSRINLPVSHCNSNSRHKNVVGANRPWGKSSQIHNHLDVGESSMGRIDHRANRLWGETSMGRIVYGAKRPWGESTMGRIVYGVNRPWGESSSIWAKRPWGETYSGRNVWKPHNIVL